jgi:ribonuclease J
MITADMAEQQPTIPGEEGFQSVVVVVDSTNGKLAAGREVHTRGAGTD